MTKPWAYYNEFDPYTAAWLRNLIAAGIIPDGEVDERSILDVDPADVAGFTQAHYFAGVGGWAFALRLAGWPDERPAATGSCPCQPLSSAGLQQGHVDKRHIWPAFYNHITKRRFPVVFGEQVTNPLGREWLAGVRADMEAARYAFGAANLPACCVGAPHERLRAFFVADADEFGASEERKQRGRMDLRP
jgi:DNA (cytosine-5)-methyltransferase 1